MARVSTIILRFIDLNYLWSLSKCGELVHFLRAGRVILDDLTTTHNGRAPFGMNF